MAAPCCDGDHLTEIADLGAKCGTSTRRAASIRSSGAQALLRGEGIGVGSLTRGQVLGSFYLLFFSSPPKAYSPLLPAWSPSP